MHTEHLARIMRISWQIQKRRKQSRSRSLMAAWSIFQNEDITVYYLTRKHSHRQQEHKTPATLLTLFPH